MMSLGNLKKSAYFWGAAYFRFWATISLKRWNPRIIIVTGSVGKTTMLHLLEAQFGDKAHYSHNANSAYGIAFDVVGLRGITDTRKRWIYLLVAAPVRSLFFRHKQPYYVVELDGERPREAEIVANWLKPEITLWVSIASSHAVYFDKQVTSGAFTSVEAAIAHEFGSVARATTGLVLYDETNHYMQHEIKQDVSASTRGVSPTPDHYHVTQSETTFTLGEDTFSFAYPLPIEMTTQIAMLRAVCAYLDLEVQHDMRHFVMPPGRSSAFAGIRGTHLIDSSYNAHLISMQSAIALAEAIGAPDTWLVIGDMIEQGKSEALQHQRLGEALAKSSASTIVLVGKRTAEHTLPVLQSQTTAPNTVSFHTTQEALDYLESHLTGGETILFKGSQYLEWLVEKLLANPADVALLARQEPAAKRRRAARGLV